MDKTMGRGRTTQLYYNASLHYSRFYTHTAVSGAESENGETIFFNAHFLPKEGFWLPGPIGVSENFVPEAASYLSVASTSVRDIKRVSLRGFLAPMAFQTSLRKKNATPSTPDSQEFVNFLKGILSEGKTSGVISVLLMDGTAAFGGNYEMIELIDISEASFDEITKTKAELSVGRKKIEFVSAKSNIEPLFDSAGKMYAIKSWVSK